MRVTSLKNKNCLITGAASGIGRALALQTAAQGAVLFLTDIDAPGLDQVCARIRASGGRIGLATALDIADYDAVQAFADAAHASAGSMDVLMNVAGISVWGSIEQLRHEHWRRSVEINLMGPIHVMECFVPAMIAAGRGGHLVNVSSAAGLFGLPWHAAYSAAKFGLRGVSEVLRYDLRRHHIDVSLVCPGGVDTGLVNTVEIVGIDRTHPHVRAMAERFRKHAVTPDAAARAILRGMRKRRYLIFTSPDVGIGYWFQTKCAPPYEWFMRLLNRRMQALAASAR
jgi:NAD(P)-dependent dehydrogenase (short-subunit alcohol dehydrogenase family)